MPRRTLTHHDVQIEQILDILQHMCKHVANFLACSVVSLYSDNVSLMHQSNKMKENKSLTCRLLLKSYSQEKSCCTCRSKPISDLRPVQKELINKRLMSFGRHNKNRGRRALCCRLQGRLQGQKSRGKLYRHSQVTQLPHLLFVLTPQLVWNCNNLPTKYSHSSPTAQTTMLLLRATSPEKRAGRGQIKVWPLQLPPLISSVQQDKLC